MFISAGFIDPIKIFEQPQRQNTSIYAEVNVASSKSPGLIQAITLPTVPETPEPHDNVQLNASQEDRDSKSDSDSSEEVILFKGRRTGHKQQSLSSTIATGSSTAFANTVNTTSCGVQKLKVGADAKVDSASAQKIAAPEYLSLVDEPERTSSSHTIHHTIPSASDDEAAMIADYIANMQRDNSSDEDDQVRSQHDGLRPASFSVDRDLTNMEVDTYFGQRFGRHDTSEEPRDEGVGTGSEVESEKDLYESEDERLATILAKQEELGLGGDDVLLLDGIDLDHGWMPASASAPHRKKKGTSRRSRMFDPGSQFPNAARMAEAFDELDLMDLQNSRLRSRKDPVSFNLSDSELEEALNVSMKRDRLKKAARKKAREGLRSQGLLGKNVNPSDLRTKYRGGMSLDDLANEVEAFMLGTSEQ